MVNRRSLLKFLAAGAGAALLPATRSEAALPKAKITRVKCSSMALWLNNLFMLGRDLSKSKK